MSQRSLRFGIADGGTRRAATWKLWTETAHGNSDVYLACRALGGSLKASLHQSGSWHIAYSPRTFEQDVRAAIPGIVDRFIEKWPRPAEIAPGVTLAFRIVTPASAVISPIEDFGRVIWLPNAPSGKATEIDILLVKAGTPVSDWPTKRSMGTSLVGWITLESGDTLWAVYWVVPMPDLSRMKKGTARFFRGKSRADLTDDGLRALAFGAEPDGSRVMYDFAVQFKKS